MRSGSFRAESDYPVLPREEGAVKALAAIQRGIGFRAERPRKYLVWCLRNSYTFVALKLAWARREGGSASPAILERGSNEAPGQFPSNPERGMSFVRTRFCSLLTHLLRNTL